MKKNLIRALCLSGLVLLFGCVTVEEWEHTNYGLFSSDIPEGNENVFLSALKHTFPTLKNDDISGRSINIVYSNPNKLNSDKARIGEEIEFIITWEVDEYYNINYDTELVKYTTGAGTRYEKVFTAENMAVETKNYANQLMSDKLIVLQRYYWSSKGYYGWSQ